MGKVGGAASGTSRKFAATQAQASLSGDGGHGRIVCRFDMVAIDPFRSGYTGQSLGSDSVAFRIFVPPGYDVGRYEAKG